MTRELLGAIIRKLLEPKGFDIEEGEGLPEEVGIDCCEGPPVPIPNTEVKPFIADDSVCENRTLPRIFFVYL